MAEGRIELAKARVLVTNDDGIGSPGIKLLEEIARELSSDVWVVAPEQEQSAASHSLTTRRPLRMSEVAPRRYVVDGTPTDCVMLAVKHLLRDHRPDLLLAGILDRSDSRGRRGRARHGPGRDQREAGFGHLNLSPPDQHPGAGRAKKGL